MTNRFQREDALDPMAAHTLVHPLPAWARVVLPRTDVDQGLLFGEEGEW